ncbi:MAG: alginate lyase family protein [Vicinamibacterales bacterium]
MTTSAPVRAPRQVYCVLDPRAPQLSVASDVLRGRFDVAGQALDLGMPPDWHDPRLPGDKEWRIELVKFTFGLDLARAFGATGRPEYARAWVTLVESWIDRSPPGSDDPEVVARRIQHWIYAWNAFSADARFDALDDRQASRIADYIAAETAYVRANLTAERNHRTLELYALLIAGLALPEAPGHGELAAFALRELGGNLQADIRADGVHREASTHYHCLALRSYLGAIVNAERSGMTLPPGYRARALAASVFAMHCHRPDGLIAAFSDADSDGHRDLLALASRVFGRQDFVWVATAGAQGRPPSASTAAFPMAGYYVQRSGWGERNRSFADERFLMFDCGPLGDGGHGHYDLLHVEIAAGVPLVVDPGRYTYDEAPPNWRRWFKGTAAHNTVVVDGTDQTPYRRRRPKGPVATGRLLARWRRDGLHGLVGQALSPCYDAVHTRSIVFVDGEYWVVRDDLRGPTSHTYDLRWHLAPEAGPAVLSAADGATAIETDAMTLVVRHAGEAALEEGWVAPRYGRKVPAPVLSCRAVGDTATFITVVVPYDAGRSRPVVREADGVLEVWRAGTSTWVVDRLRWAPADGGDGGWRVRQTRTVEVAP